MGERGYYGIGIIGSKTPVNVGTLWRSAGLMGASYIFTVGKRYPRQASDTIKAWKHIPLHEYESPENFQLPHDCKLVAVEQTDSARDLRDFRHPERAIYLLGAEDRGIPQKLQDRAHYTVQIPSDRCLNVAVAGSIVLYDRIVKAAR